MAIERQQISINKNLYYLLRESLVNAGFIKNKNYVKPFIDAIMLTYIKGKADRYIEDTLRKPLQGDKIKVFVNKKLKNKLSKRGVLHQHIVRNIHASYLVEKLIEEYLIGSIPNVIDVYFEIKKTREELK